MTRIDQSDLYRRNSAVFKNFVLTRPSFRIYGRSGNETNAGYTTSIIKDSATDLKLCSDLVHL